ESARCLCCAQSKLQRVLFTNDHGAGVFQSSNDFCVFSWNAVFEERAGARCLYAGCVDQILQADRNAVQWTTPITRADLIFRLARLGKRTFVHDCNERIDRWIELLDTCETSRRELNRRNLFAAQQVA